MCPYVHEEVYNGPNHDKYTVSDNGSRFRDVDI